MIDQATSRTETAHWRLFALASHRLIARLQPLALWAILVLAALLRFYCLGCSSLWSDEGNTWALLSRSFAQIARDSAADIHPPGYYWLLKLWTTLFGASAVGMRSFSAAAGVILVWLVYHIVIRLAGKLARTPKQTVALLAALLAALNPFQIYYSQEARMYMLLALESAGLFWALLALMQRPAPSQITTPFSRHEAIFVLCAIAGLWTHYSFPVILGAAGLAYLLQAIRQSTGRPRSLHELLRFAALNLVILLAFLPWLPTAIERVQSWPKGDAVVSWEQTIQMTVQTLLLGPLQPALPWRTAWLVLAGALPTLGLAASFLSQSRLRSVEGGALVITLWLLAPIVLMIGLGLYSDAFLKFLLIASPPWCIAIASTVILLDQLPFLRLSNWTRWTLPVWTIVLTVGALLFDLWTLPAYYADPASRDNYAGVARTVAVLGDPEQDLVILNAPGQQEVWQYYDPGLPVLAVPLARPPDPEQTVAALAAAVAGRRNIYALFWATDEADPNQIVESWLNQHAFKSVESWQGNLRFAVYSLPGDLSCQPYSPAISFAGRIALTEACQAAPGQPLRAGDVFLVELHWQALTPLSQRYHVTLQLLDPRGQVIAQHDGEPGGSSQPTDGWTLEKTVSDRHGVMLPLGAPPGAYRLIVALYDSATGQRLSTPQGEAFELGQVTIAPPQSALPVEILPLQHRVGRMLGPVRLLGYRMHHKGFSHAPETPVQAGDLIHFTFYWQTPEPRPVDWPEDLRFTLRLGDEILQAPLAGGIYPTGEWQAGEIVRGEFDLRYDGGTRRPQLTVGDQSYRLAHVPAP